MLRILIPALLTAGIGGVLGAVNMWIERLARLTIRSIDEDLAKRHGYNFYDADIQHYLGFWKFLRSPVMRKMEKKGCERLPEIDERRGYLWLRRS
jgi:hypothetical protein